MPRRDVDQQIPNLPIRDRLQMVNDGHDMPALDKRSGWLLNQAAIFLGRNELKPGSASPVPCQFPYQVRS